jgi:hypothetical protein
MSTSGVFSLLTNDGKADRLIMATEFLNQRINNIICMRRAAKEDDESPTLKDIEKTHILFMNSHFKPFAAIGFEYQKVRSTTGNPALGNAIMFSIPVFGDFFHDMVLHTSLSAVKSTTSRSKPVAAVGAAELADGQYPADDIVDAAADVPLYDWDNTTPLHTRLTGVEDESSVSYSAVDHNGVEVSGAYLDFVRYVEFPGERITNNVKFEVNGNPLDNYDTSAIVMMRKFTVSADKMIGYKRLVGQEVEIEGFGVVQQGSVDDSNRAAGVQLTTVGTVDTTDLVGGLKTGELGVDGLQTGGASNTEDGFLKANFPDTAWTDATITHGATAGYQSMYRESLRAVDGLQTPKLAQPPCELWSKLRFWFNERVDQALASVCIPSGQRYITIDLATQDNMVVTAPSVWVKRVYQAPKIVLVAKVAAADAIDAADNDGVAVAAVAAVAEVSESGVKTTEYRPLERLAAAVLSTIVLSDMSLYVNNLFVNPEIHDIYINRVGFSLIRVFRSHTINVNTSGSDDKQLSQLKWPIEYMMVGLRPTWNIDKANVNMHRDWHRMCKTVDVVASGTGSNSGTNAVNTVRYVKECKTLQTMSLTAHGIKIMDHFPERFFSAYTPYTVGGSNIVTPADEGCLMFNFSLYPGSYQPSGHINVSRAREFYLGWTSNYTSSTSTGEMLVIAKAINFLLLASGSAVLRFST